MSDWTALVIVFVYVSLILAFLIFTQPLASSLMLLLVVAIVATIVEAISPFGIDNLTVPLVSALILFLGK